MLFPNPRPIQTKLDRFHVSAVFTLDRGGSDFTLLMKALVRLKAEVV